MTIDEKKRWVNDQLVASEKSVRLLESAKKGVVSEYDERIRELNKFRTVLWGHLDESGQLELFDVDTAISDKITKLIRTPLVGL